MILYIVRKNSYNKDFGHCNFALELLHFFIEMFKTNIDFYQKSTQINNFKEQECKRKYLDYRRFYYQNIYISEYSDEKSYKTLKNLKEQDNKTSVIPTKAQK